jgi:hypothetical protein
LNISNDSAIQHNALPKAKQILELTDIGFGSTTFEDLIQQWLSFMNLF